MMTKEEMEKKIKDLETLHKKEKSKVYIEYALSNNPYKEGEVVEAHDVRIRIDSIKVSRTFSSTPECVYAGSRMKKDNTPYKSGERASVWQSSARLVIK